MRTALPPTLGAGFTTTRWNEVGMRPQGLAILARDVPMLERPAAGWGLPGWGYGLGGMGCAGDVACGPCSGGLGGLLSGLGSVQLDPTAQAVAQLYVDAVVASQDDGSWLGARPGERPADFTAANAALQAISSTPDHEWLWPQSRTLVAAFEGAQSFLDDPGVFEGYRETISAVRDAMQRFASGSIGEVELRSGLNLSEAEFEDWKRRRAEQVAFIEEARRRDLEHLEMLRKAEGLLETADIFNLGDCSPFTMSLKEFWECWKLPTWTKYVGGAVVGLAAWKTYRWVKR